MEETQFKDLPAINTLSRIHSVEQTDDEDREAVSQPSTSTNGGLSAEEQQEVPFDVCRHDGRDFLERPCLSDLLDDHRSQSMASKSDITTADLEILSTLDMGQPLEGLPSTLATDKGSKAAAQKPDRTEQLLLPSFANEANRQLAAAIQQLVKEVDGTDRELGQNLQRTSEMASHLRSLQLELASVQSQLEARNRELETEKHLEKLHHHEKVSGLYVIAVSAFQLVILPANSAVDACSHTCMRAHRQDLRRH